MIIKNLEETENRDDDQWDGTDVEPVYPPRMIKEQADSFLDEQYISKYREGDHFS